NHGWLTGGFLGVEVFFVISGYLITLLLLSEKERTARISLRKFWLRRARRLLPALYTMLCALAIYMTFFSRRPMGQTRGDFLAGVFYVSNWFQIWSGQSYTAAEAFSPLRHLWSLAVEEQFYLIWPVVMAWALHRMREKLPRLALWLVVISLFITAVTAALYVGGAVFLGADPVSGAATCGVSDSHGYLSLFGHCINVNEALYLSTPTRLGGLLLGSAFAIVWRPVAIMRGPLRTKGRRVDIAAVLGLALLAVLMNRRFLFDSVSGSYDPLLFRGGFFLVGLVTLACIAAATHRRSWVGRLMGVRPLNWLGTRSYGLYLYHWPIFQIIRVPGTQLTLRQFGIALLITVPVTELSYRLIERPIRQGRFGEWMRGERPARTKQVAVRRREIVMVCCGLAVVTGFAAVSVATADVLCVGQIQCDSEKGQAAIAAAAVTSSTATTTTAVSSTTTVVVKPGDTVASTSSTTTTVSLTKGSPVFAIGESVMLGAAPLLEMAGVHVNAAVSRQGRNVAEVVTQLHMAQLLGKVVIVQTGTNGPVSDDTFAAIMQNLSPATTPLVVFLTVHAPRGWIADNNTRIRALPQKYKNVKVVDWDIAAQQVQNELSVGDGRIHLATAHAKQYYANLIFDAIGRPDLKK
ncbi:MAG: acyltransferase family protein, partial [Actinomycetota bacterium]